MCSSVRLAGWNNDWNTGYILPLNEWRHLCFVHNVSVISFYLDGNYYSSTPNTYNTVLGPSHGIGGLFNGSIDEIVLYNRSLTSLILLSIRNSDIASRNKCDGNL